MQPTVTVNQQDIRDLDATIANVAIATKRSIGQVLVTAAVYASRSAAKATPQSPKNRKTIANFRNTSRKTKAAKGIPWWANYQVEVYKNGIKGSEFLETPEALAAFKPIQHRGVARKAWIASSRLFGKTIGSLPPAAKKYSFAVVKKDGGSIRSILLENRIKYIAKAAPNSAAIGISKANASITTLYLRAADRNIKRQMRAGKRLIGAFL